VDKEAREEQNKHALNIVRFQDRGPAAHHRRVARFSEAGEAREEQNVAKVSSTILEQRSCSAFLLSFANFENLANEFQTVDQGS
jgi:hypothetical protein